MLHSWPSIWSCIEIEANISSLLRRDQIVLPHFILLRRALRHIVLVAILIIIGLLFLVGGSLIRWVRSLFLMIRPSRSNRVITIRGMRRVERLVVLYEIQGQIKLSIVPWRLLAQIWGISTEDPTVPYQLVPLWLSLKGLWLFVDSIQFLSFNPKRNYYLFASIFLNRVKVDLQSLWGILHKYLLSIEIDFLASNCFRVLNKILNSGILDR